MVSPEADCNPDTLCVTSGMVCNARVQYFELYDAEEEYPQDDRELDTNPSYLDGMKLRMRLTENSVAARRVQCSGMVEGMCPVRELQNNSSLRTLIVGGLRKTRQSLTMNRERV